ncbi:hypothetical protein TNIN_115691 [Trichonephila inaurata madagascariensis]|uniref:Uncharacterized protein n=1 Tax=Trichonephila inaurata madagascariensis TaxID=2747483 RepID=A0A8X6X573_9ARAC|nr:hypothetical protein TNIN_115691 [Trichonephila inaurata madagascariensis]
MRTYGILFFRKEWLCWENFELESRESLKFQKADDTLVLARKIWLGMLEFTALLGDYIAIFKLRSEREFAFKTDKALFFPSRYQIWEWLLKELLHFLKYFDIKI